MMKVKCSQKNSFYKSFYLLCEICSSCLMLGDHLQEILNIILATQVDRTSFMQLSWHNVEHWLPVIRKNLYKMMRFVIFLLSRAGHSSSLLKEECHGHTLVKHTQLAIGVVG